MSSCIDELDVCKCTSNLNILYVEDDSQLREETTDILESFFSRVDTAVDGLDGLVKYTNYKNENALHYDLVITDLNMPNKDGQEMIADIREKNPDQAIIVISAYNESQRLIDLIHQGIANFVMKPINPEQLMAMLYKTCKNIANEKLKEKYIQEQAKMASIGEMIESISHQWRQPLNTINGLSSLMIRRAEKGKLSQEDIEKYLHTILGQTKHLSETVDIFRNFMKEKKEYKTVILQNRILQALSIVSVPLSDNFINLKVNISQDNPIHIKLVTGELAQVIINIVNNAKDVLIEKHIDNPWVEVRLSQENNNAVISIEDNAGGIPKDVLPKVFERYFTTKDDKKGTGIGLYMSKNIVTHSLHGDIYVKNSEYGAKFFIVIPITVD